MPENEINLHAILHRVATWLTAAGLTVLASIVWDNHNAVSKHGSLFDSVWSPDYKHEIDGVLTYPRNHDEFRALWIEVDSKFKREMLDNCAAYDKRLREIEKRITIMETNSKWRHEQ